MRNKTTFTCHEAALTGLHPRIRGDQALAEALIFAGVGWGEVHLGARLCSTQGDKFNIGTVALGGAARDASSDKVCGLIAATESPRHLVFDVPLAIQGQSGLTVVALAVRFLEDGFHAAPDFAGLDGDQLRLAIETVGTLAALDIVGNRIKSSVLDNIPRVRNSLASSCPCKAENALGVRLDYEVIKAPWVFFQVQQALAGKQLCKRERAAYYFFEMSRILKNPFASICMGFDYSHRLNVADVISVIHVVDIHLGDRLSVFVRGAKFGLAALKLRPDFLPVIRTKVAAGYAPLGRRLNRRAVLYGDGP